jgi:hypothetical protein
MKQILVEGYEIHQKSNGRWLLYVIQQDGHRRKVRGDFDFYANAACALAGRLFR